MKNIKILSILFILILSQISNAQKEIELSLNLGFSKPLGNFGCSNCFNGGHAMLGESIDIYANFNIYKGLGIIGLFKYQNNELNNTSLRDYYNSEKPLYSWYPVGNNYNTFGLMTGLRYRFTLIKKIHIEPKFVLGLLSTNSPTIFVESKSSIWGDEWLRMTGKRKFTLSYMLGANINYQFTNKFAVGCFVDFLTAEESYNNILVEYSNKPQTLENYNQNIMTINYGLSFSYRFFNKQNVSGSVSRTKNGKSKL